jgi:hypothetical protein
MLAFLMYDILYDNSRLVNLSLANSAISPKSVNLRPMFR